MVRPVLLHLLQPVLSSFECRPILRIDYLRSPPLCYELVLEACHELEGFQGLQWVKVNSSG